MDWKPQDLFEYHGIIGQILRAPTHDGSYEGGFYEGRYLTGDLEGQLGLWKPHELKPIAGWRDAPNAAHGKVYYPPAEDE